MKLLGLLFIGIGLVLCFTLVLAPYGFASLIAGALLCLVAKPNPQARFDVTPGVGRRLAAFAVAAVGLLGLVWYAELMKPAPPAAPTVQREIAPAQQSSPARGSAKTQHPRR